jgi:hypothetical protein
LLSRAFHHRSAADRFNKGIPHIRQRGVAVETVFFFHLDYRVADKLKLVFVKVKPADYIGIIAFDKLGRRKTQRDIGALRMVFDDMADRVNTAVNWTRGAESRIS